MQIGPDFLLLFDAHGPEALCAFFGLAARTRSGGGSIVCFCDTEGEEGEREELEDFCGGEGGCQGWEVEFLV